MSPTVYEPLKQHRCQTPGNLKPKDTWPEKRVFGTMMRAPVLHEIGSLWQCHHCRRWWHCCDTRPNPPGGPYRGGGRVWRRVRWWHRGHRKRINERIEDSTKR